LKGGRLLYDASAITVTHTVGEVLITLAAIAKAMQYRVLGNLNRLGFLKCKKSTYINSNKQSIVFEQ
jgi:hypothetical protein